MISEEYKEYLRSDTWQRLRSKRLAIDEYRCQRCGTPYGPLQVHHLAYPAVLGTEDPYMDLITLCADCHELIEHNKHMHRKDKKDAIREQRNFELRTIYHLIKRMACYDLSALDVGDRDYCSINVIKEDFGPLVEEAGIEMMGYVSRVQDYFRNRRYRIILKMMGDGFSQEEILRRTRFSRAMVEKVCTRPETARQILNNEIKDYWPDEEPEKEERGTDDD